MRNALNNNPIVQMAVIGVLALIGGLFLIKMMSKGSEPVASTGATGVAAVTPAPGSATPAGSPASTATTAAAPASNPIPVGPLVPGDGLPGKVLASYDGNDVVVLLIVRNGGIDDNLVRTSVDSLKGTQGVSVFVAHSRDIAKYAQITQGVGVDRVPALIVVRPKSLNDGAPQASVAYGFRSAQSVRQAVKNALYDGPRGSYDPG